MRILSGTKVIDAEPGWREALLRGGRRVLIDLPAPPPRPPPPPAAPPSRPARKPARGGVANAHFVVAAVAALPAPLHALADLVCVNFPWGGLLRGLLQPETAVLRALASLAKPGGRFQLVLAYDPQRDSGAFTGEPLPVPDETYIDAALVPAYGAAGLAVEERRRLSREEALAIPSTWGRRLLPARPRDVFLLRGSVR